MDIAGEAVALYNCANPPYDRWLTDWPPLASSLLATAERTGAVLVSMATLYGYGPVTGPMTESTPLVGPAAHPKLRLRADMWRDVLAAHDAGRIRATEVRSSDFLQGTGIFSQALAKPLLAGKRAIAPMPLDQPHTVTSVNDVAATLVTLAADEVQVPGGPLVTTVHPTTGAADPASNVPSMSVRAIRVSERAADTTMVLGKCGQARFQPDRRATWPKRRWSHSGDLVARPWAPEPAESSRGACARARCGRFERSTRPGGSAA